MGLRREPHSGCPRPTLQCLLQSGLHSRWQLPADTHLGRRRWWPTFRAPGSHGGRPRWSSQLLPSAWPRPGCRRTWGREPADETALSLSVPLFQINKTRWGWHCGMQVKPLPTIWHPIQVLVQHPAALLSIQIPADVHGKAKDGPNPRVPAPTWESQKQLNPSFSKEHSPGP